MTVVAPAVGAPGYDRWLYTLARLFPGAATHEIQEFTAATGQALDQHRVLVIPAIDSFPVNLRSALNSFLNKGGRALLLGPDPFAAQALLTRAGLVTRAQQVEQYAAEARALGGISTIQLWQPVGDSAAEGSIRAAQSPQLPWEGVLVVTPDLRQRDGLELTEIPPGALPAGINGLVFYARGDARTTRLVLEFQEQDGATWRAAIPLADAWRPVLLPLARLQCVPDRRARGYAGDRLRPDRVTHVFAGLDPTVAPQAPGLHEWGLSDLRFVEMPGRGGAELWPDLLMASPPYRQYPAMASSLLDLFTDDRHNLGEVRISSPRRGPRNWDASRAGAYRWQPLFSGLDDAGRTRGWAASIGLAAVENGQLLQLGWIGMAPDDAHWPALRGMVGGTLARLAAEGALLSVQCPRFLYHPDDVITARVTWRQDPEAGTRQRVAVELITDDGRRLRRSLAGETNAASHGGAAVREEEVNLGRAPAVAAEAQDYIVRVALEDAGARAKIHDEIRQVLRVLPPQSKTDPTAWIKVVGAQFVWRSFPVFFMGVNYRFPDFDGWPTDSPPWLDPAGFSPETVSADLAAMRENGFNTVAVRVDSLRQVEGLRFFIDEATRQTMRVYLVLDCLAPLAYDMELATQILAPLQLAQQPIVFALGLGRLGGLTSQLERRALDPEWESWLTEQFGDPAQFARVCGRPVWLDEAGRPTSPADSDFIADGPHQVAVAMYRRFLGDCVSRRVGFLRRWLRAQGYPQLISVPGGDMIPMVAADARPAPLDMATGAAHLDFVSLDGRGLQGPLAQFLGAGFLTAYARGISGGKPVVWMNYGWSLGPEPQPGDLENQALLYQNMMELISRTFCQGGFAQEYDGTRAQGAVDMALINADGTWRPAAKVILKYSRLLRAGAMLPAAWQGRLFQPSGDARGLAALRAQWEPVYARELAAGDMLGIRPLGWSQTTATMLLVAVGGAKYTAPAPLECANSEWGQVEINGREWVRPPGAAVLAGVRDVVRLELVNTGPATWAAATAAKPGAVALRVTSPDGAVTTVPVREVQFGKSSWVSWTAPAEGTWKLRPQLQGYGQFGEGLLVNVVNPARMAEQVRLRE